MAKKGKAKAPPAGADAQKTAAPAAAASSSGQKQGGGAKSGPGGAKPGAAAGGAKGKKAGGTSTPKTDDAPAAAAAAADAPKPTVKQIIGGQSWTGKLPVTLLAEHVQKQGWLKPDYSQHRSPDGTFSNFVTLSARDPKTQEIVRLDPFKIHPLHKHLLTRDTALESRHAAATYALYRVCSMQNKHMVLPPDYKTLWKEFEAIKKDEVKEGKAWMYEADPFKALRERQRRRY
jgi:ATP-dependent RNA helicase DHX57